MMEEISDSDYYTELDRVLSELPTPAAPAHLITTWPRPVHYYTKTSRRLMAAGGLAHAPMKR